MVPDLRDVIAGPAISSFIAGQLSRLSLLGQLAYFVVAGGNVTYCLRSVDPGNLASHRLFESYNFTGEIASQGRSI